MKDPRPSTPAGTRRLAAILAASAAVAVSLLTAGAAARTLDTARPRPAIDPQLVRQLGTTPAGAQAVVTTWTSADLARVERLGIRGTKLRRLPMLLTRSLTGEQLGRLARAPFVRSVHANARHALTMEDTTWLTRARYVWSARNEGGALAGLGITGKGVDVAVIDTGADGGHEDMDNLVEFCETQQALTGDSSTVLCSPFDPASGNAGPAGPTNTARGDATDDNGHGTHVSGTIAGSGDASGGRDKRHSTMGLSPNARLHVYSANVGPSLASFEILAAYDDMIDKKLKGLSTVVAVNNSWGGGTGTDYNPDSPQSVAFEAAYDAGILSVFAAGNSGPEHNTLSAQCVNPWVVCVAATTKPDSVVMFSSRGRPSEPADTNRDGVVGGTGDVPPANHDRRLGQAYGLGLYRPALAAPGVNINSIRANSAQCREILRPLFVRSPESAQARGCYEPLNGTSMATPHVTGAVPLIVEAYRRGHGGKTPSPGIVTDILERSANVQKLPGAEAEEQGAGRLDVYTAATFARTYPNGLPRANLGTPSPPYEAGRFPGAAGTISTATGCTGTASWTVRTVEGPLDPVGQPPLSTERYGQHVVEVPERTERLRVTVSWPEHPGANLYARLWRPGVDPDAETEPAGQKRVFPDQEALGLVFVGDKRFLDVRAPEAGRWTLRVYHRAGGAPTACGPTQELPKQTEGYRYSVGVELPQASLAPTVAVSSPAAGSTLTGRWTTIRGTASYPSPWDGVTNYEVTGSGNPTSGPPAPDTRTVLYFHGNASPHAAGEPREATCTGDGAADLIACRGPFLLGSSTLAQGAAASWKIANPLLNGAVDRTIFDPSWTWYLSAPTTVAGPMTVEWWASCGGCDRDLGLDADWRIRLWADGVLKFQQRVTATPASPGVAERLETTVSLPTITANERLVLHVDPVYIDSQNATVVYYDSASSCPTAAAGSGACDSLVRMPVGTSGASGPGTPQNLRVTDVHSGLRIAWDSSGAAAYEVHRSTDPAFAPTERTRIATTAGTACDSPSVPSWPTASRPGLCFTDATAGVLATFYYRVVALDGSGGRSAASLLSYGRRTEFDRQVRVEVDRLYSPQTWEYASLGSLAGTSWLYLWDKVELLAGPHPFSARSFTQGIGSAKATQPVTTDGGGGRPGRDDEPDDDGDDDGDGDDDDDHEDEDD